MLPPFKIRNLQQSTAEIKYQDSIVRISAPQYDDTISQHPEAILSYLDEVDCDLITVGTSFELSQRLEEPLQLQPASEVSHHTFDIQPGPAPRKVWQEYRQPKPTRDDKSMQDNQGCFTKDIEAEKLNEKTQQYPTPENLSYQDQPISHGSEIGDYCKHFTNTCQVPSFRAEQQLSQVASYPTSSRSSRMPDEAAVHCSPYLTNEGKRQARAAGDRLRVLAGTSRYPRKFAASFDAVNAQKRWASYSRASSPFLEQLTTPAQASNTSHWESKRQALLAGDKLRSPSIRIRHHKSVQSTENGISKTRSANPTLVRTLSFEDHEALRNKKDGKSTTKQEFNNTSHKSLLQLFECELASAKRSSAKPTLGTIPLVQPVAVSTDRDIFQQPPMMGKGHNHDFSDVQHLSSIKGRSQLSSAEALSSQLNQYQSINQAIDCIGEVIQELRITASSPNPSRTNQHLCDAVQIGLSAALQGFHTCVRNILSTVQQSLVNQDYDTEKLQQLLNRIQYPVSNEPIFRDSHIENYGSSRLSHQGRVCHVPAISKETEVPPLGLMDSGCHIGTESEIPYTSDWSNRKDAIHTLPKLTFNPHGPPFSVKLHGESSKEPPFLPLPTVEPAIKTEALEKSQTTMGDSEILERRAPHDEARNHVGLLPSPSEPDAPPRLMHESESSGEFFNRMTGRGQANFSTIRPRPSPMSGPRCGSTVGGLNEGDAASNHFPGNDISSSRVNVSCHPGPTPPQTYQRHLQVEETQNARVETQAETSYGVANDSVERFRVLAGRADAIDHSNAATAGRVQECAEKLKLLGYGNDKNDGLQRLVVYAQIANGNLGDAIDMIDEEHRAYQEWV